MGEIQSKQKKEDRSKRKKERKEGKASGVSEAEQPKSTTKPLRKTDTTQKPSGHAGTESKYPLRPQQLEEGEIVAKDFQPEQPPKSSKSKGKGPEKTFEHQFDFKRYRKVFGKDQAYVQLSIAANNYHGLSWTETTTKQHFRHEVAFGEEDWEKLCDGLNKRDMEIMEGWKANYYHAFAQTATLEGLLKSSTIQYEVLCKLYRDCLELPLLFDTMKYEKNETKDQYDARLKKFLDRRMENFLEERSMSGGS